MYTPLTMCEHLSQLEIAGLLLSRGAAFEEALAFVRRGIHTLFLELEPDWENS